jgi:hypothetical protein
VACDQPTLCDSLHVAWIAMCGATVCCVLCCVVLLLWLWGNAVRACRCETQWCNQLICGCSSSVAWHETVKDNNWLQPNRVFLGEWLVEFLLDLIAADGT